MVKCVSCGKEIPFPKENYLARGNYCGKCSNRASHLAELKKKLSGWESLPERIRLTQKKEDLTPKQRATLVDLMIQNGKRAKEIQILKEKIDHIIATLPNYYKGELW